MPHPLRSLCWMFAATLALSACRPGDAPKEPADPNDTDPQVSSEPAPTRGGGGVSVAVGRRSLAVAKL